MSEIYGQVVVGAAGTGKTSYCKAITNYLKNKSRNAILVNLDPANDLTNEEFDIDIRELITIEYMMQNSNLGPNESLLRCVSHLHDNKNWLLSKLEQFPNSYFIFDCPGQIELFTIDNSIKNIFDFLISHNFRLVSVNLVSCLVLNDPYTFIGCIIDSLTAMIFLEMPALNVISKIDLISNEFKLDLPVEFYFKLFDLEVLLSNAQLKIESLDKISQHLISVVEEYGLVSFIPLSIFDDFCLFDLTLECDKANGYIFGDDPKLRVENLFKYSFADVNENRLEHLRSKYFYRNLENDEEG